MALRSSSLSSSSRAGGQLSAVMETHAAMHDSCTWYADGNCTKPRSCFDCLNVPLTDGSKCAINPNGACVALADYAWRLDYRRHAATELTTFYPSSNTTYCSPTEPGCAACRRRSIMGRNGLYGYTSPSGGPISQCTGRSGCVCVAACETIEWRTNVSASAQCSAHFPTTRVFGVFSSKTAFVLLGIAIAGLLVLLGLVRRCWISHRRRERHRLRFATLRLGLEGWYTLRRQLIDDEHTMLGLKCNHNEDRERSVDAPSCEDDGPPAAGLLVHLGAGFRPESPSEYESQRQARQAAQDPRASVV